MPETCEQQVDRLAKFILAEVPGEPKESEGAVDTAIRVIKDRDSEATALRNTIDFMRTRVTEAIAPR